MTPVEADVDAAHALIDAHLWGPVREQPSVQHVEYDPELRRWYVRFGCDGRDAATIYFDLHQRTLRYELYFLPSPEDEARRAPSCTRGSCAATTTCTARASRSDPTATCT